MKIVCNREKLLTAFQTAAVVVPTRSPKPVLQNVKIEATEDAVTLVATDMEVGIRLEVQDQQVESPGSALLSVSQFGSILRESVDSTLRIEADGQGVVVQGERSRFKLPSGNPDEFPEVAGFRESDYHIVSARLLKDLIRRTSFATDMESSRYALGGVLLEFDGERIVAVSTDGRRLAKMEGPLQQLGNVPSTEAITIVPARSMRLLERTLQNLDDEIHVASRGNDLLVRCPSATIITRLVEGRFPRWREVLPHRPDAVNIQMTVGPMHTALRQAATVSSGESRGIDFVFGNGLLILSGLTADVGESRVEIPISYDGEEIILCLDNRFVSDFLKVLDSDSTFLLNISDSESAALFETNDGYGYVVMPLSVPHRPATSVGAEKETASE